MIFSGYLFDFFFLRFSINPLEREKTTKRKQQKKKQRKNNNNRTSHSQSQK